MAKNYIKEVCNDNKIMPDSSSDVDHVAGLHSWYKMRGEIFSLYPILCKGVQTSRPLSEVCPAEDLNNYHWKLVQAWNLETYQMYIDNKLTTIPKEIIEIMKQCPVHIN